MNQKEVLASICDSASSAPDSCLLAQAIFVWASILPKLDFPEENMTSSEGARPAALSSQKMVNQIISWLDEHKGIGIIEIPMGKNGQYCDCMILVTATSMRHAQGLADGLVSLCHEKGQEFLHMEGYNSAQWILLDLNDVLVHIFLEDTRRLYGLETLWGYQDAQNIIPLAQEALHQ